VHHLSHMGRLGGPTQTALFAVPLALLLTVSLIAMPAYSAQTDTFTPRLTTPRLAPLGPDNRTEAQKAMLASRADYNIYKTLAHHPDLYARWSPLGQFLLNGSSLPPRERELVMLRMGWLCQSEYEWSQHARIAKASAGMTDAEVHRIAEGPTAAGWSDFERTLLRMVDELRYETMISDATWQALRTKYTDQQIMESLFTTAQYQLVSMALNSLGVQLDPELSDRLPKDLPLPALATRPSTKRPTQPRIKALKESEMTQEQRELVKPLVRDGSVPNLYATVVNHPKLYGPRRLFGSYLQRDSLLPPKTRELLIMRNGWNIRAEYEWAHHVEAAKAAGFTDAEIQRIAKGPAASGWSEEHAALLSAADELRREAIISNATWTTLQKYYDSKQLVEIIYTVGGYTMTGLAINSFGIQVEPEYQPRKLPREE
jgi:4-carboxymuconolactone decarboxylase